MKVCTYNEVDTNDLFGFAKEHFGHEWNRCCQIFERTEVLNYNSYKDFYAKDIEGELPHLDGDEKLAYEVLLALMKHHNVKEIRVLN